MENKIDENIQERRTISFSGRDWSGGINTDMIFI